MDKAKNRYFLPVNKNDIVLIISDPKAHKAHLKYALDFLLPEDTKIFATCDGEVIDVKVNSNEGGLEEKYLGQGYIKR